MAFYLSQPVTTKASQHPLLLERDVQFRTLAPLNLLNIFGRVTEYEIAYAGYVHNIAVFLSATNRGARLLITAEATGHSLKPGSLSFAPPSPPVSFVFRQHINEERQNQLAAAFPGKGITFTKSGDVLKCTIKTPDNPTVKALEKFSAKFARSSSDELHIAGWDSYLVLIQLINDFLSTNTYSAFYDVDSTEVNAGNLEFLDILNMPHDYKGYTLAKNKTVIANELAKFDKSGKEVEDEDAHMESMTLEHGGHMREVVASAKPSPFPSSNNCGSPSSVPNQSGIFFPYFHKMVVPDYVSVPKIIGTHFFRYLGATVAECQKVFEVLVSSWSSLNATKAGMILTHVLFGIRTALQTQTRLYVLLSGREYHGFCLLGAKFAVFDGKTMVSPQSKEELHETIRAHCSKHYLALGQLAQWCSETVLKDGGLKEEVDARKWTGALSVMKDIGKRAWTDDEMEQVKEFLGKVDFGRHYWPIGHQTLVKAVRLLTSESATPLNDEEYPAYVGLDINQFTSRAYQVLSFFGPNAPSFRNRGGEVFTIPSMTSADVDNEATEGDEVRMKQFIVSIKKLSEAAKDFEDMVRLGQMRMNQKERAAKYRNIILVGQGRDELWETLRICVPPLVPVVETTPPPKDSTQKEKGKKRAASVGFDEEFDNMIKKLRG